MAANLKSLAKDTAIYGMSSIVGRFLNYLLVPLYTAQLSAASGGYGVITNLYSWTALLLVMLTYGMETTFFAMPTRAKKTLPPCIAPLLWLWVPPRSCLWPWYWVSCPLLPAGSAMASTRRLWQ